MLTVTPGVVGDMTAPFSGNAPGPAATTLSLEAEAFSPFVEA